MTLANTNPPRSSVHFWHVLSSLVILAVGIAAFYWCFTYHAPITYGSVFLFFIIVSFALSFTLIGAWSFIITFRYWRKGL